MNRDIIRLDKYTFKFEDIDLIYPVYIRDKGGEKYYSLYRVLSNSNYSRKYQLDHRSTQAIIFDKLIELDYFKLLGIDYNFIPEFPLINTNLTNDPNRSYYLLDYFIPDLSLCIELDSSYHDQNPIKDKLKDQFLNSIGIDVYRIYNFQINTKSKLESLVEYIKRKDEMKFELSYEELVKEGRLNFIQIDNVQDKFDFIKPKWRSAIRSLINFDKNLEDNLLSSNKYTLVITLNEIYRIIPRKKKEVDRYKCLVRYLERLGVHLDIKSWTKSTR